MGMVWFVMVGVVGCVVVFDRLRLTSYFKYSKRRNLCQNTLYSFLQYQQFISWTATFISLRFSSPYLPLTLSLITLNIALILLLISKWTIWAGLEVKLRKVEGEYEKDHRGALEGKEVMDKLKVVEGKHD